LAAPDFEIEAEEGSQSTVPSTIAEGTHQGNSSGVHALKQHNSDLSHGGNAHAGSVANPSGSTAAKTAGKIHQNMNAPGGISHALATVVQTYNSQNTARYGRVTAAAQVTTRTNSTDYLPASGGIADVLKTYGRHSNGSSVGRDSGGDAAVPQHGQQGDEWRMMALEQARSTYGRRPKG
jgi:hypothetical protein